VGGLGTWITGAGPALLPPPRLPPPPPALRGLGGAILGLWMMNVPPP